MEMEPIAMATCEDGINEMVRAGVNCGGSCEPCMMASIFLEAYTSWDHMGRPGINTVFRIVIWMVSLCYRMHKTELIPL